MTLGVWELFFLGAAWGSIATISITGYIHSWRRYRARNIRGS